MEIPKIVGAGIVVLGVGIGLGKIGAAALEAIARQPEQSGKSKQQCLSQLLVEGCVCCLFAVN
jgi:F-type H+-transporting ATPase subunit c